VNESSKTATLVNFAVDSNGQEFVIRDVGTFSPGVSIAHQYRNGSGQSFVLPSLIAPNVTCRVASVKFSDGSVCRPGQQRSAPSTPAASSTISVTPTRLDIDRSTDSELFLVTSNAKVAAFRETDDCQGIAAIFVAPTGQAVVQMSP
jgi:hypothetical protein